MLSKKMKHTVYQIVVALVAFHSTIIAAELVEVSAVSEAAAPDFEEMPYTNGEQEVILNVNKAPIVSTADVATMTVSEDPLKVNVEFSEDGSKKMTKGTEGMSGKRLAIIIDGKILVAPVLNHAPLARNIQISGFKNAEEAKALVDKFNNKKG